MKFYSYVFIFIFLLSLVSASLGSYKLNECVQIKTILNATLVNISTISYPNGTIDVSNLVMDKTGQTFSYIYCNTTQLGTYIYDYFDESGNVYVNDFEVTPSGVAPTTAQSGLSIGIMISIIAIMFFFGFLAFKFMDYPNLNFLSLFFLALSVLIAVYGLYLGFVYSRDYLYATTSNPQGKLFTGIMMGLVGMTLISMTFFTIKVLSNLKVKNEEKQHGEGWNTHSKQYDY